MLVLSGVHLAAQFVGRVPQRRLETLRWLGLLLQWHVVPSLRDSCPIFGAPGASCSRERRALIRKVASLKRRRRSHSLPRWLRLRPRIPTVREPNLE